MKTDLLVVPMGASYADIRRAATVAEEAGFDGLWTWDHLRDPDGGARSRVPEVWTVLSALAEATQRLQLGPLVLNVASRHPGLVANMAATLQEVSGGRLLLGIGAGANRRLPYVAEHESLGLTIEPDAVRAQRVAEAVQVMRRLWAGDESRFSGNYYQLDGASGFLRSDPPPPVIVGGFGPRMAAIAGRYADGFNTQAAHPRLAELVQIAREEHAKAGRDPARFVVTVFGGLRDSYLRRDSVSRGSLERLGVDRLIMLVEPPFEPSRLRDAGRLLAASH